MSKISGGSEIEIFVKRKRLVFLFNMNLKESNDYLNFNVFTFGTP